MDSLISKCQHLLKLQTILCATFYVLASVNAMAQAPNCSTITYNTDNQSRLEIDNLARLQCMSNDITADYILANDIDASETATWNEGAGFEPVGERFNRFIGTLDGNGFSIQNLTINRPDSINVGLFRSIDGQVRNLGLENVSIIGLIRVGAVAGYTQSTTIEQVFVSGSVQAINYEVGGLAGIGEYGTIINCYSIASIQGEGFAGGIIGAVVNSFNFANSFATGKVTVLGEEIGGGLYGGFYDSLNVEFNNMYWNVETAGQGLGYGIATAIASTTSQMKDQGNFTDWDFTSIWSIDQGNSYPYLLDVPPSELPGLNDGTTVTPFSGGLGTYSEPFQIENIEQLQAVKDYDGYNFELINDIDASETASWNDGLGFEPIGSSTNPFNGFFFGNNHKITGLTINRPGSDYVGLFARRGVEETRNLALEDVNIVGKNYVGSIAGRSDGLITKVYATGSIKGDSTVGGLVGSMALLPFINELPFITASELNTSYNLANVTGISQTGGIAGQSTSKIRFTYSTGLILGSSNTGGLLGVNSGTIEDSYWNVETSGQSQSSNGIPITNQQMKFQVTFTDWNFSTIWRIDERESYPYFIDLVPTDLPGIRQGSVYAGGLGTIDDPFLIRNIAQFQNIRININSYFALNADINAAGTHLWNEGLGFTPIGDLEFPFKGKLDGKGHSVNYLSIDRTEQDRVGIFSVLGEGAQIRNLGVQGIQVEGRNVVGGLAGSAAEGTLIESSYVTGQISGVNTVGGLAGLVNGEVNYVYTLSTVSGNTEVGGVIGSSGSTGNISQSYAAGNVFGTNSTGAVLGQNNGATLTDSYWNSETSVVAVGVGGGSPDNTFGLTTEELLQPDSLKNWDFGFSGNWSAGPGNTYPWLSDNIQEPAPGPMMLLSPNDTDAIIIPANIKWASFPVAISYQIQVSTDPAFETVLFDSTGIQDTTLSLTSTTLFDVGETYYWKVRPNTANWSAPRSFVVQLITSNELNGDIPASFSLYQNYPNPFNPTTTIRFNVPQEADVAIEVYSMLGQKVMTLANKRYDAGSHQVEFDANQFSSGLYIYRIKAGDFTDTKKMMLVK